MKHIILFLFLACLSLPLFGQIAVNADGSSPDASAMLDVKSTAKGMLVPRMSTAQRTGIAAPTKGLLVFDNTAGAFYYHNGTVWVSLSSGGSSATNWSLTGNAATNPAANFIGTTDNQPLQFRVNGAAAGTISGTLDNTSLGLSALLNGTGINNTAFGKGTLTANTSNGNTAVGSSTLIANTTGAANVAFGRGALLGNTTGSVNTAIGRGSLNANTTGYSNVALGTQALFTNAIKNNLVAVGDSALYNNGLGATGLNGDANTAIGSKAMFANTLGRYNTALGSNAFFSNTDGIYNNANGSLALYNSIGWHNTANGFTALYNTTGRYNTASGVAAMNSNTSGEYNTALGIGALEYNQVGFYNTAVGADALHSTTASYANTALGMHAGANYDLGNANTFVGSFSDASANGQTNSGAFGDAAVSAGSNQTRFGDVGVGWIGGQVGWSSTSDRRLKTNIQNAELGLAFILKLRPINYDMDIHTDKKGGNGHIGKRYTGFVAQEVEAAAKELGTEFFGVCKPVSDKDYYSLRYAAFTVPLVKAAQEQQAIFEQQQATLNALKAQQANYDGLGDELAAFKAKVQALLKEGQEKGERK